MQAISRYAGNSTIRLDNGHQYISDNNNTGTTRSELHTTTTNRLYSPTLTTVTTTCHILNLCLQTKCIPHTRCDAYRCPAREKSPLTELKNNRLRNMKTEQPFSHRTAGIIQIE